MKPHPSDSLRSRRTARKGHQTAWRSAGRTHHRAAGARGWWRRLGVAAIAAGALIAFAPSPAAAIVGGDPAPAGRWPWMVAIVDARVDDPYLAQYCGGTVVAADRVLTAGHCVLHQKARNVAVLIGRTRLSAGDGRRVAVRAISVFPGYASRRQKGLDAAILELAAPAGVAPLALAGSDQGGLWLPGTPAWTLGWGRLTAQSSPSDNDYYGDRLRELQLPLVSDDACEDSYGGGTFELPYRPAWTVCAGTGQGGTGSCFGDSGGPLVVGAPGTWLQVGILTGGDSCAAPGYYDLYARADRLRPFALTRQPAEQPDPVAHPSIAGRFAVGARVRCVRGRWRGSPARFSVRWVRLDAHSRHTIGTGTSHRLTAKDLSHRVTCIVTARNRGGMNTVAAPPRRVAKHR